MPDSEVFLAINPVALNTTPGLMSPCPNILSFVAPTILVTGAKRFDGAGPSRKPDRKHLILL
jgi:hypothetical protein